MGIDIAGSQMGRSTMAFPSGALLRREMLEDLYSYPRIALESYFASYSDGILYGLGWRELETGAHEITPGALKLHGEIYFLHAPLPVEDTLSAYGPEIDHTYKIVFMEDTAQKQVSRTVFPLQLRLLNAQDFNRARDSLFYYAYVEYTYQKHFQRMKDSAACYGLYAGNDGYAFAYPPEMLVEEILPRLEQKRGMHTLDYFLLHMA